MAPAYDGYAESPHAQVTCYGCHAPDVLSAAGFKGSEVFGMYPRALTIKTLAGPAPSVSDVGCLSCHESVMSGVTTARGIRIRHEVCGPTGCGVCHAAAAHGQGTRVHKGPWMDECVRCHLRQKAPTDCDTCHEGKRQAAGLSRGPWQVTHGADWPQTHGMGDLSLCETCHEPQRCVGCHGLVMPHPATFGVTHGREALTLGRDRCGVCHDTTEFCDGCHTMPMPHPVEFLQEHSSIATSMTDETCLGCHEQRGCEWCHERHVHPGGAGSVSPPGATP